MLSVHVAPMYVFRAGHLVLDNQLLALPWGRLFLPRSIPN